MNFTGFLNNKSSAPSSSASFISGAKQGISSRLRRYTIVTFSAPRRIEVLAASIAVLPPPTTITFFPFKSSFLPMFASLRKSRQETIPFISEPSTLSLLVS